MYPVFRVMLLTIATFSATHVAAQDAAMVPPELAEPAQSAPDAAPPPSDTAAPMDAISTSGTFHSETHSSSSETWVSPADPAPDATGMANNPGRGPNDYYLAAVQALAGRWLLSGDDGVSCSVNLTTKKWSGDKFLAGIPAGCPGGLFVGNSWRLNGNRLELNRGSGEAIASFRAAGPNQWQGQVAATGQSVNLKR